MKSLKIYFGTFEFNDYKLILEWSVIVYSNFGLSKIKTIKVSKIVLKFQSYVWKRHHRLFH